MKPNTESKRDSVQHTIHQSQSNGSAGNQSAGWPVIFASMFGAYVAIALFQRMWPARVEVVHKSTHG